MNCDLMCDYRLYYHSLRFCIVVCSFLSGSDSAWVTNPREKGVIYECDNITVLPGISQKTFEKFEQKGVTLVKHFKDLSALPDQMMKLANDIRGISLARICAFVKVALQCLETDPPVPINHRQHDNPFLSRYGEENWESMVDKLCMTKKVCVTELIDWIFLKSKALVGNDYLVFHDSLSLMCSADSVEYMQEKGYYEHWILPANNLMDSDDGSLKTWARKPLGNRPELMPLGRYISLR